MEPTNNYAERAWRCALQRRHFSFIEPHDAEKQLQVPGDANFRLPTAHEMWGSPLVTKGDITAAIRGLQAAVQLQPDVRAVRVGCGARAKPRLHQRLERFTNCRAECRSGSEGPGAVHLNEAVRAGLKPAFRMEQSCK